MNYPPVSSTIHCINPQCPRPAGQIWGNNYCQSCGAPLVLNGRYVPLQCLGSGGFSNLYTVWDFKSQTEKVLKVLVEPSPKALELFEQEATVLGRMHHPGVPKVDADGYFYLRKRQGSQGQLPCLVMEKINGPTLQQILEQNPQGCPEDWVIDWLHQALEILRELHGHQIIHRDLKPSNLMLRLSPPFPTASATSSQLVMIDFGGAKQIGILPHSDREATPRSTTRLISPGYSPPEQVVGGVVGPPADFYALGRTCIHLLTGKFPAELEDPLTGEFRWRQQTVVSPWFANLLDQMVEVDPRQRPQTATEIQTHLFKIARFKKHPRRMMSFPELCLDFVKTALIQVDRGLNGIVKFSLQLTLGIIRGCLETAWEMTLGSIGAIIGTVIGLMFAYASPLGEIISEIFAEELPRLFPDLSLSIGSETLVLALAGLGTAIGLTDAGGFNQRRRYLIAGLMGMLGYSLGGISTQILPLLQPWTQVLGIESLEYFNVAIATALLTLGLGLRSHHFVHAFTVGLGTATMLGILHFLELLPNRFLGFSSLGLQLNWQEFGFCLILMSFLGCTIGLYLGISHYLIVPILRRLGWQ